ncbi:glycosyl transferase, partial [Streptomyces sp. NPDC127574]
MRPEGYDYDTYSRLAGPLTHPAGTAQQVQYTKLLPPGPRRTGALILMTLAPALTATLLVYLLWPTHWVERENGETWLVGLDTVMLVAIGLIELFMLVNVVSIAHATLTARDPVPLVPEEGTRVAFLTTYVPGKEPLASVRATLEGALRVTHAGLLHVWLLDEGDDDRARDLCAELGVRHFTRHGIPEWNRPHGAHKARTKHGNYNAWLT